MEQSKITSNIEAWKKSLLDITSRNQAINFRRRKSSTLEIVFPTIGEFLDKMISAKGLSFAEIFDDEEEDEEIVSLFEEEDDNEYITLYGYKLLKKDYYTKDELIPVINAHRSKVKGNFLYAPCNNRTQRKILRNLMKKARTFKEENAINVLYFAVGQLEWFESKESDEKHKAPLLYLAAELSQDSFDSPFKISFPEGDLMLNDSLLRKFSQDFKLELSFEMNQSEMSNLDIYNAYKSLIMSRLSDKRWKIHDEMDLGIFSFSKINMVKDLEENKKQISESSLIKQLIGESEFESYDTVFDEDQIDGIINPNSYFHILDADSSQEIAIQSAIAGKNFVLQGPPGTGKSQTITNIITELIARNKKVLFVAEKKAALDVVYNNLKKIGLNDYALPIHNSKLDKKEVLKELSNTLEKGQGSIDVDGQFSSQQIYKYNLSKADLTEYPKILLQKRYPINKSLYQLYGILLKYQKYDEVKFNLNTIHKYGEQDLLRFETLIQHFFQANQNINFDVSVHPWFGLRYEQLNINEKETIYKATNRLKNKLDNLKIVLKEMTLYEIKDNIGLKELDKYIVVLKHLKDVKNVDELLLRTENLEENIRKYQELITLSNKINGLRSSIEDLVEIELAEMDIVRFKKITIKANTWIKRLFSKDYKKVYNEILEFSKIGKIKSKLVIDILVKLENYKKMINTRQFENNKLEYPSSSIGIEQYSENLSKLEWVKKYREAISSCIIINTQNHYEVIRKYLIGKNEYDSKMASLFEVYNEAILSFNDFVQHINLQAKNINAVSLNDLIGYVTICSKSFSQIDNIIDFNLSYNKCINNGLSDFCNVIIDQKLKNNYYEVFLKRFYTLLIDGYLSDLLPGFSGSNMDVARGSFKDAERAIQTMAKTIIERNIMKGIPNYNGIEGYNIEVTILRTEANKSRKLFPFRVLFSKIPNLITRLKPCLMMSPLSVSTFLRGTNMTFDTVIFDEASQVKPENAIGAIFRAKQIIVTGDKEQLPPTNFFQNIDGDDEQDTENMDTSSFDSILDVSSSSISPVRLRWHYRSKFEELIRPSNKEIYKDLITFPSITKPNTYEGIMFCHVNGLYMDRKNEVEADKVIESLANILEKYGLTKSVGVVTFNGEQQLLIERKINHFRRTHAHYEEFFANIDNNPFFVKNIETVQGDERDIIIMSIGYGPDGKGKVSMNFGPLNQTNGYRRLNVAVTRAKSCLVLVTSIRGTDIDLNRTNSRGVAFLKHYLEYAEFGEDDKVDNLDDLAGFDSPFEVDVYNELISLGYDVKKQVGCSGYRIDLAIINPNNPAEFILGIECDGATYHSSKSVRDRDRLRQQVLEDRNWIIYRIWSTDWIKNKKSQIEKLSNFIKGIDKSKKNVSNNVQTVIPIIKVEKEETTIDFIAYPNYANLTSRYDSDAHDIYITKYILEIIKETAPIHEDELKKVVPYFWGRQKYTSVVDAKLKPILRHLSYQGEISRKGEFIYHKSSPILFRKTDNNSTRRDFTSIHTDELKNGILMILEVTKIMKEDQLLSMVVEFCGYQSISANIREIMNNVITSLVKSKLVIRNDDSLIELILSQKEE